jgi:hypothetical protein
LPLPLFRRILVPEVNELEQIWPQLIDAAADNAASTGRHSVAEYLRLKATNDVIRTTAVAWLVDTFLELLGEAMSERSNLIVEREEPYTFQRGASTMVGTLIEVRQGVRRLGLAAGWTRAPAHGIMQNNALAYARFIHFGMPKAGADLRLVRGDELPQWLDDSGHSIDSEVLRRHLEIMLS